MDLMIITITIDGGDESSWIWDSGPTDPDEGFAWALNALESAQNMYTGPGVTSTHDALIVLASHMADLNASIRELAPVEPRRG